VVPLLSVVAGVLLTSCCGRLASVTTSGFSAMGADACVVSIGAWLEFLMAPFLNLAYHKLESKKNKQILLATFIFITAIPTLFNIFNFSQSFFRMNINFFFSFSNSNAQHQFFFQTK